MNAWLAALGSLALAVALRIAVSRATRAALSVDHWFWKAYVEACRRDGRFPPTLPQYLLDEEQWYPPVFPWLLLRLPGRVFEGAERLLGVALDLVRMSLLLAVAAVLGGGDWRVVAAAGLVYATSPILVIYNVQLNPRALGALFLDGAALLLVWIVVLGGPGEAWFAVAVLSGLALLSHKMTAQLFWFGTLAASIVTLDCRFLPAVPLSLAAAWLLSGGFYAKVLRAHADIVAFWNRNWRWLHADPIRESSVYGDDEYRSPALLHQPGPKGVVRHAPGLLRLAPVVWIAWALVAAKVLPWPASPGALGAAMTWGLVVTAFALLTTFVPALKCLGAGSLYLYNAVFPVALFSGLATGVTTVSRRALVGLALGVTANAGAIALFAWRARRHRASDDGWDALLARLASAPRGPVLCLPQNLYDELAYRTRQPVLFGAHGYGFRKVEPFFPRLHLSFPQMRERYGLRYVVAREGTLNEKALADLPENRTQFGSYSLFDWAATSAAANDVDPAS